MPPERIIMWLIAIVVLIVVLLLLFRLVDETDSESAITYLNFLAR